MADVPVYAKKISILFRLNTFLFTQLANTSAAFKTLTVNLQPPIDNLFGTEIP